MSVLKFATNVPVEVALAYSDGKEVEGNYGPQIMFSLAEAPNGETTMYVPPIVADRLAELQIGKGQRALICKGEVQRGNRHGVQWQVSRVDPDPRCQKPNGEPIRPEPAPIPAKVNSAGRVRVPGSEPINSQSTANGNGAGNTPANGNGHAAAAPLPPMQVQFGDALQEFLVLAGRASHNAEVILGTDGASVRFDSRDIAATATSMFIEAARRGSIIWTPGGAR